MKVLLVHNFYQQGGGEDVVFQAEQENLRRHGVDVQTFTVSNDSIGEQGQLKTAVQTLWNAPVARQLAELVSAQKIDVVHFHNTFPLVSPAAYWAVRARGAAVVQTLHNFRLLCASATLYREQDGVGRVCEDCLGKLLPVPAVRHACYRGSRAGSAVLAAMQVGHRALGSYSRAVDRYVALSETGRQTFIRGGLPAARISVKPNFLAQGTELGTGLGAGSPEPAGTSEGAGYALFVGRLTQEKGVLTLLDAWKTMGGKLPLKIVGDGPLLGEVERRAALTPGAEVLGRQDRAQVQGLMNAATLLVVPSEWPETFGMVVLEAFASGLPVVASEIGALASLVEDGVTGQHFRPGDAAHLAQVVTELSADPARLHALRQAGREAYLARYTAEINVQQQLEIYRQALAQRHGATDRQPEETLKLSAD